jgi:hypothetical protein
MLCVILLASADLGCRQCPAVAAVQGLEVQMTVAHGPLRPGAYTILVDADGLELRLDETLDANGVSYGGPVEVADGDKHLRLDGALSANAGDLVVGYREGGGPSGVIVTIRQAASVLAYQAFQPSYLVESPAGDSCPSSLYAQAQLTVTAP